MYKRKCRNQVKDKLKLINTNVKMSKRGNEKQREFKKNLKTISRCQADIVSKNSKHSKSKRVTVPIEFFSHGNKSKTIRKAKVNGDISNRQSKNFLNEDLHALLHTVSNGSAEFVKSPVVRHSKRLFTKQSHYENITDYFVQLQSENAHSRKDIPKVVSEDISKNQNTGVSDDGYSVFKEINCTFENKVQREKSKKLNKSTKSFKDNSMDINHGSTDKDNVNIDTESFCMNLENQLASISLTSRRLKCGKRINSLVEHINAVLEGKEVNCFPKTNCYNAVKQIFQKDEPVQTVTLLPKHKWIYKTPINKQSKPAPICNTAQLIPGFLKTVDNSKILMEIDLNSANLLQETYVASCYNYNILSNPNKDLLVNFASPQGKTGAISNVTISPIQHNTRFNEISKCVAASNSTKFSKYFKRNTAMHEHNEICIRTQKPNKRENLNHFIEQPTLLSDTYEKSTSSYLGCTRLPHDVMSEIAFPFVKWNSNETVNKNYYNAYDGFPNQINDENLLFPSKPELNEPSPLEFHPRKIFDEH